jgi:hypothetical protein
VFKLSADMQVFANPDTAPQLLVFVDTEEEFSWDSFSRSATGVVNIAHQHLAQAILNRYCIIPTYLIDYPVATQANAIAPLKEMLQAGQCHIGAQLHSWVTPPFEETVSTRNSFQGNLPAKLECAKITALTKAIEDHFDLHPTVFKAGRNGFGHNTVSALIENGYTMDNSVLPYTALSVDGPDFTGAPGGPFWLDQQRRILEIPMTEGLVGSLNGIDPRAARLLLSKASVTMKLPGLLARTGMLERIRLTPEGISVAEAKRLTQVLLSQGRRLFVICYHSSSLLPGSTPYVRNQDDLGNFLGWLSDYLEFFFGALDGRPTTPAAVLAQARLT